MVPAMAAAVHPRPNQLRHRHRPSPATDSPNRKNQEADASHPPRTNPNKKIKKEHTISRIGEESLNPEIKRPSIEPAPANISPLIDSRRSRFNQSGQEPGTIEPRKGERERERQRRPRKRKSKSARNPGGGLPLAMLRSKQAAPLRRKGIDFVLRQVQRRKKQ